MEIERWKGSAMIGAGAMLLLLAPLSVWSHGIAGKRFFPTTLTIDDPFMNDEASLTFSHLRDATGPDEPSSVTTLFSGEWAKTLFAGRFGIFGASIDGNFQHKSIHGQHDINGFGNMGLQGKWQFFTSDKHETLLSIGVGAEVGGTGDSRLADPFSTVSPIFFFGQGGSHLPDPLKMLRPLAITGTFSANFPMVTQNELTGESPPTTLSYGFVVQYNIQYLQSFVKDVGLRKPFNRMIPLVEFPIQTCINRDCDGQTTGFAAPGVIWFGKYIQLGLEALIPINERSGQDVGVVAQLHFFIDDMFPRTIGKPIFGSKPPYPAWWGGLR
jgi:hypothetical protein